MNGEPIIVRNPFSIRPYQHVLECIYTYLMIAARQYEKTECQSWYNVGPNEQDYVQTGDLVDLFVKHWGEGIRWISQYDGGPHEACILKLDNSRLKAAFGWQPRWNIETAVEKVVEWSKAWHAGQDVRKVMDSQIEEFLMKD